MSNCLQLERPDLEQSEILQWKAERHVSMSEYTSMTNSPRLLAMEPALASEMRREAGAEEARRIEPRPLAPMNGHNDSGESSSPSQYVRRERSQSVAKLHRLAEPRTSPCLFLLEFPENNLTSLSPETPLHELGNADEAIVSPDKLPLLQELSERDETAHSLILCEHPPVGLARLIETGMPSQQALRLWCARTAQLLAFVRRFRRRMTLLDRTAFWQDPQTALMQLSIPARLESPSAEQREKALAVPSPLARLVAVELLRRDLRAVELAGELEASTTPLTQSPEDPLDLDDLFRGHLLAQEAAERLAKVEQQAQLAQDKAKAATREAAEARENNQRTARHLAELQEEHEATLEQLLKAQEIAETDRLRVRKTEEQLLKAQEVAEAERLRLRKAEEKLSGLEQRSRKQAKDLKQAEKKAAQQTQRLRDVTQEVKKEARRAREAERWLAKRDAKLAWIYGTRTYRWTLWLRWLGRKMGGTSPSHWNA